MLDRAKFEGNYTKSDAVDWHALTSMELRLIKLYRRMSVEDQNHVRRMSELLLEVPDPSHIDRAIS
jgi:hypothetical protein